MAGVKNSAAMASGDHPRFSVALHHAPGVYRSRFQIGSAADQCAFAFRFALSAVCHAVWFPGLGAVDDSAFDLIMARCISRHLDEDPPCSAFYLADGMGTWDVCRDGRVDPLLPVPVYGHFGNGALFVEALGETLQQ